VPAGEDFIMQATFAQANRAIADLRKKLTGTFKDAASNPVQSVGISSSRYIGYYVDVRLARPATADEKPLLPSSHKSVTVKYTVAKPGQ
jgi:hypothetical protein